MSLIEFVKAQGIELLPWQQAYAEAVDRGEHGYMATSKQAGRTYMMSILKAWRDAEDA